ncbi:hypothetical protein [Neorhodopirellula lusitana]|nr:hypothetical protein [Neorhodopirellula lusitana]
MESNTRCLAGASLNLAGAPLGLSSFAFSTLYHCVALFLVVAMLPVAVLFPVVALGQELPGVPVQLVPLAGEEVEVKHLGTWRPGVVLDAAEGQALVSFDYSGRADEKVFDLDEVRYPWQPSAISPVYLWKDSTGEHSIEAAVSGFDEEAKTVTLVRRADGSKVTLPIDNLGSIEKRRVRILIRTAPPPVALVPPLDFFGGTEQLVATGLGASSSLDSLTADPAVIRVAVPMGGAAFEAAYKDESLIGIFPIGSSRGWILGATLPKKYSSKRDMPSRLIWATLDDGKVVTQHLIAAEQRTLAVHARSQQIMTLGTGEGKAATLTIWKSSPKMKEAEAVVRWESGEHHSYKYSNRWGLFINGRTVLHRMNDGEYAAYDFVAQKTLYKFGQDSRSNPEPALSPGHRYLAIPEGGSVRVVDAATGQVLANLPVEGGSAGAVAFDQAGEKLAILSYNEMAVWTVGSSQPPRRVRADLLTSASRLAWVDDNHLLVGGNVLFSLNQALPVWSYRPQGEVVQDRNEPNTVAIASSRLCYGVRVGNSYRDAGALVIGAVELPGPSVRETVAGMDRDELFVLEPGVSVRLTVECGEYNDQVRSEMMRHIESNHWQYDPDAPIHILASMTRDEPKEMLYIKSRSRFGFGGMSIFGPTKEQLANAERVTSRAYRSTLRISQDSERLWGTASAGAIPSSLRLEEGQSVESMRSKYERPRPEMFTTVKIPAKLYDPRYRGGFGVSTFGKLGLDPKPLSNLPQGK